MILWYIALVAPFIAIIGLAFLSRTLPRMTSEFRGGMVYLLLSASLAVLSGIVAILLVLFNIETSSFIWNLVPVIYFLSNISFVINVRSIEKVFRVMIMEVEENTKSKPYEKS